MESTTCALPIGCFADDPNGKRFIAMMLYPEGWVVLSPWIKSFDGYCYRHHIQNFGQGSLLNKEMAEHLANELNKYLAKG